MKKSEILALGITEELADKLVEMAKADLDGYVPKSRFDEVNEAKKNAEALVKERDKQLDSLKDSAKDIESLTAQIDALKAQNKESEKQYNASINQMKIDNAVAQAIREANGKNATAIKALLNLKDAKLSDDGTVDGLADQIKALTEAEDSSFLFGKVTPKGFEAGRAEGGAEGGVDFSKMSYSEITEYLSNNPEARI